MRAALPAVYLAEGGEGPVAVRLGGNPMLPDGAPEPGCAFVAAVDCALIPPDAAGLPLPSDGQLLLFAAASVLGGAGRVRSDSVVYVPAGTPATERPFAETWRGGYPQRQLRTLWRQLSWPEDEGDFDEDGEWRDVTGELGEVWSGVTGRPRPGSGGCNSAVTRSPVTTRPAKAPAATGSCWPPGTAAMMSRNSTAAWSTGQSAVRTWRTCASRKPASPSTWTGELPPVIRRPLESQPATTRQSCDSPRVSPKPTR